ncbi:MAG: (2Fe-2S)-binding protein [Chloroflexi bacterium]|nr:(2Fe-2S)-binding protein [Chloroflexota bacterium]
MLKITVNGDTFEAPEGKRLVLAIRDHGVHIGHRCGGFARCTTCRVEFEEGEPDTMTRAEFDRLTAKGILGQVRLSCQIACDHHMSVRPLMTLESEGWTDTGPEPEPGVTPEAKWYPKAQLFKAQV